MLTVRTYYASDYFLLYSLLSLINFISLCEGVTHGILVSSVIAEELILSNTHQALGKL